VCIGPAVRHIDFRGCVNERATRDPIPLRSRLASVAHRLFFVLLVLGKAVIRIYLVLWLALSTSTSLLTTRLLLFRSSTKKPVGSLTYTNTVPTASNSTRPSPVAWQLFVSTISNPTNQHLQRS